MFWWMFLLTSDKMPSVKTSTRIGRLKMPRKDKPKPVRGIFERPPGSGVWWVHFYENGARHCKKVGSRGDAVAFYQKGKAAARRGRLLPECQTGKS